MADSQDADDDVLNKIEMKQLSTTVGGYNWVNTGHGQYQQPQYVFPPPFCAIQ